MSKDVAVSSCGPISCRWSHERDTCTTLLPCVIRFDVAIDTTHGNSSQTTTAAMWQRVRRELSTERRDYVQVLVADNVRQVEESGAHNSLFLAIARHILLKLSHANSEVKHEQIARAIGIQLSTTTSGGGGGGGGELFKLTSEAYLQQALRRRLCLYWLSQIDDRLRLASPYANHFDNVCDFVYEVYQMSINNWSGNRLFAEFALADLATLLGATILVFKPDATNVYEPASSTVRSAAHDYIILQMDSHSGCFKWLLPRCHEVVLAATIRSSPSCLFNVASASRHYAAHFFVIGATCLLKYAFEYTSDNMRYRTAFGENASLRMFFAFLSEAPTHTIIAGNTNDERVAFGRVMDDRRQMAAYLNRLCGRARFCGDQMLALIERERIQSNYEGQVMAATLLAKELRDAKDKQQQQQQQQQQKQRKRRRLTDLLVCSSSKQHDESSASNVDSGSSATTAAACAAQLMLLPPLKRHNSLLVGCDAQEAQVATKIDTVTRLTRPPRLVHSSNLVNTQQQTSAAAAVEPTRPRNKTITQLHTRRSVDICLKN